jgi:hypothetical protein
MLSLQLPQLVFKNHPLHLYFILFLPQSIDDLIHPLVLLNIVPSDSPPLRYIFGRYLIKSCSFQSLFVLFPVDLLLFFCFLHKYYYTISR